MFDQWVCILGALEAGDADGVEFSAEPTAEQLAAEEAELENLDLDGLEVLEGFDNAA